MFRRRSRRPLELFVSGVTTAESLPSLVVSVDTDDVSAGLFFVDGGITIGKIWAIMVRSTRAMAIRECDLQNVVDLTRNIVSGVLGYGVGLKDR